MKKDPTDISKFLKKVSQTDLFPNRETVGREHEIRMIVSWGGV